MKRKRNLLTSMLLLLTILTSFAVNLRIGNAAGLSDQVLTAAETKITDDLQSVEVAASTTYITSHEVWESKEITGDVVVQSGAVLTLTGTVKVSGTIYVSGVVITFATLQAGGITATNYFRGYTKEMEAGSFYHRTGAINVGTLTLGTYNGNYLNGPKLNSLEIIQKPLKLDYTVGEQIDKTGLIVYGHYSDGSTDNLTQLIAFREFDRNTLGEKDIFILIENQSIAFKVNYLDDPDTTPPSIDIGSLSVNTNHAIPGDTIALKIKATDSQSGVQSVNFFLQNDGGSGYFDSANAIDSNGYYAINIPINDTTYQGNWYLYQIDVTDRAFNKKSFDKWDYDLSAANFEVAAPPADVTGPVVDLSSLYVTPVKTSVGNTVKFRVKATDVQSGVDQIIFSIRHPSMGYTQVESTQIDDEGYYSAEFMTYSAFPGGQWFLTGIMAFDKMRNLSYYDSSSYDLSKGDFFVINWFNDTVPPVAELNTISVNNKTPIQGESVKASVKASDDNVGVSQVQFVYSDYEGTEIYNSAYWDNGYDYYEVYVSSEIFGTGWVYLKSLTVTDENSNSTYYDRDYYDLSAGDFLVKKRLDSVHITSPPRKTEYVIGQQLDITGLVTSGIYSDGSTQVLPVSLTNISGFDSSVPATGQIVTVTVEGKAATFKVDIVERKATEVKLISYPAKVDYLVGETLDLTGLSLEATFNDGSSEILPLGDLTVAGFDSSSAVNNQVITITYGTWKFTYEISINPNLSVTAFAGNNRYHTAALISQATYEQSDIAILAQGLDFPDALAAGPLAKALNAPILLSRSDRLSPETEAELMRLGVKKIIILGGTNAINEAVEATLKETLGYETQRLAGLNRYTTALEVAEYIKTLKGTPQRVVLTSGTSFADALSIGSYAASEGLPILTTSTRGLVQETLDFLTANNIQEVSIVGGVTVVPVEIEDHLKSLGITVKRIYGDNRESTSAAIANELHPAAKFAVVANGMTFPDALAAAPYAAKFNAPILLVRQDRIHDTIMTYLTGSSIHTIRVAGGEAAVSGQVRDGLFNAIQ